MLSPSSHFSELYVIERNPNHKHFAYWPSSMAIDMTSMADSQ